MDGFNRMKRQLVAAAGDASKPVPEAGQLLWSCFVSLSNSRGSNGYGPLPIRDSEIEAWTRLNRMPLEPRHVQVLRQMDRAWIDAAHKQIEARQGGKSGNDNRLWITGKEPPMTAEMFDAVLT